MNPTPQIRIIIPAPVTPSPWDAAWEQRVRALMRRPPNGTCRWVTDLDRSLTTVLLRRLGKES